MHSGSRKSLNTYASSLATMLASAILYILCIIIKYHILHVQQIYTVVAKMHMLVRFSQTAVQEAEKSGGRFATDSRLFRRNCDSDNSKSWNDSQPTTFVRTRTSFARSHCHNLQANCGYPRGCRPEHECVFVVPRYRLRTE